ncbi:vacuolar fusion protein MON1 homolog A [Callorhinchus milii]|uniref:Vacuolar fusion protein MON1 homolog n=1 Tax=Callorhinchus milii TaxID=7868 RepID=A0A4W3JIE3_CALMI|nr:vacuolar fusion protein MON1 homolog A [Callorhinchus milii]XP_042195508.1 vacuolar fusion protein MON1 homolog A [Callorhinchus milii]XP_042195509.1 vacuolar fusion protein MON1 homolog A [Callorhinchus milii]XP_042195510.1 vacuolar fusion protein MON1 homolog A [Callorhinchus milii]|eukprot:gi/632946245/ref/XP_007888463.1/ PREDICTED: vacuolar fusion protein MON1 homolog A [Callorhinchus milii]
MEADVHNKKTPWEINGSLAPAELQRNNRSESPTPGLVEGTEPGARQDSAMFVHTRSYEDLTGGEEEKRRQESDETDSPGQSQMEEISKDFSELSTQLNRVVMDEEIRDGEVEGTVSCRDSALSDKEEDVTSESWRQHRKHVFVFSEAGKPIYSRYGTEEALSTTMGVMVALVSVIEAGKNVIKSIHAEGYKVVFIRRSPLVLVAVARTRQSEQEVAKELLYIYYQIISLLTLTQLNRIFEQKTNYDLRRLLSGSERITDNLLNLMDRDPSFLMCAVRCLPLSASLRDLISGALQQAKDKSLVFSILIAQNQLVTLVRKKDQFLHPVDLHLLFNLISASSSFREGEVWTPICLPKFNSNGFFHTHISYLDQASSLCLMLISTESEHFFTISNCKRKVLERLNKRNTFQTLLDGLQTPSYCVSQVGISDLRHFIYKSRSSGLFTSPEVEHPYVTQEEQERLLELYQHLYSRIHNSSRPLKYIYYVGQRENLLAWVTSGFELYMCFSPMGTKTGAVNAITKLMKWIRKEEERLFILNPLTY